MKPRTMLTLAAIAAAALACNRTAHNPNLDQNVMARLSQEPALAATDVHVRADGGHVYLSGRVRTNDQRKIAGEVADDVKGVDRVTNDIQVEAAATPPAAPNPGVSSPPPPSTLPEATPPAGTPEGMPSEPMPNDHPTGEAPPPTPESPENNQ